MRVEDALFIRKSTRAFLKDPVDMSIITNILEQAKLSPSGDNHQPWQVAVLTGKAKDNLCSKLEEAFRSGKEPAMDYEYYPQNKKSEKETKWFSSYKENRKACGLALYSQLGITREMKKEKDDLYAKNYRGFDAPVILIFFIDKDLGKGSYVDYGIFLQSIMLAAIENGLATCPQAALGEYPEIVREELGYPQDKVLICGMAVGYEDKSAIINSYRTPREELDKIVRYFV